MASKIHGGGHACCSFIKTQSLDPKDLVTHKELALSSVWETSALVELLERKGILTKLDVLAIIQDRGAGTPTRSCESAAHGTWPTVRR